MWSKAPPATKEEAARIELAKVGPCMACLALVEQRLLAPWQVVYGCDYNHAKSGNIRRGHAAALGDGADGRPADPVIVRLIGQRDEHGFLGDAQLLERPALGHDDRGHCLDRQGEVVALGHWPPGADGDVADWTHGLGATECAALLRELR